MVRNKKIKAVGLLSGGLDSTLAAKMMLDQKIDVYALNFTSPLCLCSRKVDRRLGRNSSIRCESVEVAEKLDIPIKIMAKDDEYAQIVKKPKHGYGKNMNPCIDCRIYAFVRAKKYMKKIGAKFIFTGEVLDQRPMSQHGKALMLIEKESGLKGYVLRPLSAKMLPETIPEKKKWINRKKLLGIKGRQRREQMKMMKNLNWEDYHCPSGGCLLTYEEFAKKVMDLVKHKRKVKMKDFIILRAGRHFRYFSNKIIVGREEHENKLLKKIKEKDDFIFEAATVPGPITVLQGKKSKKSIEIAARLTARYSDAKARVKILYGKNLEKTITVTGLGKKEIEKIRI